MVDHTTAYVPDSVLVNEITLGRTVVEAYWSFCPHAQLDAPIAVSVYWRYKHCHHQRLIAIQVNRKMLDLQSTQPKNPQ